MEELDKKELLKQEILSQYKSVRQFSTVIDVPYSTLVTALQRGIDGMAYETVLSICEKLSLNPVTLKPLTEATVSEEILENSIMKYYVQLNQDGRDKILNLIKDYSEIDKYRLDYQE